VFSKSKIFKFLKRDWGTIPVAEILNGKIEIFSKHQRFLIATESSKYLLIFVLYVCVILCEFGTAISKRYANVWSVMLNMNINIYINENIISKELSLVNENNRKDK
jgi:hypothetical protein